MEFAVDAVRWGQVELTSVAIYGNDGERPYEAGIEFPRWSVGV